MRTLHTHPLYDRRAQIAAESFGSAAQLVRFSDETRIESDALSQEALVSGAWGEVKLVVLSNSFESVDTAAGINAWELEVFLPTREYP